MPYRITLALHLFLCVRPDCCPYWRIETEDRHSIFLSIYLPGLATCSRTQYRAVTFDQHYRDGSARPFFLFFFLFVFPISCTCSFFKRRFTESHFLFILCLTPFKTTSWTSQEHFKQTNKQTTGMGTFILRDLNGMMLSKKIITTSCMVHWYDPFMIHP